MTKEDIKKFLEEFLTKRERTVVIVDFGNVEKWKNSLGWSLGIKELGQLTRYFSFGKQFLRRFYYGSDYGKSERSRLLAPWSDGILGKARMSGFEIITKRVKYIHDSYNKTGFEKKCDLDVEMMVDLIKEKENYDTIILFSGDGDLMYAIRYLQESFGKECFVFGARNHVAREIFDAKKDGCIKDILYVEDFEYRLRYGK